MVARVPRAKHGASPAGALPRTEWFLVSPGRKPAHAPRGCAEWLPVSPGQNMMHAPREPYAPGGMVARPAGTLRRGGGPAPRSRGGKPAAREIGLEQASLRPEKVVPRDETSRIEGKFGGKEEEDTRTPRFSARCGAAVDGLARKLRMASRGFFFNVRFGRLQFFVFHQVKILTTADSVLGVNEMPS